MPNSVFQLVKSKQSTFQKKFAVTFKAAKKTNAQYLFLEPLMVDAAVILIKNVPYTVNQYHISVYDDLRIKKDHKNTSYHLTLTMTAKDQILTARIYFN